MAVGSVSVRTGLTSSVLAGTACYGCSFWQAICSTASISEPAGNSLCLQGSEETFNLHMPRNQGSKGNNQLRRRTIFSVVTVSLPKWRRLTVWHRITTFDGGGPTSFRTESVKYVAD